MTEENRITGWGRRKEETSRKGPCEEVAKTNKGRGPVLGTLGTRERSLGRKADYREAAPRGREASGKRRSEKQEGTRQVWPHRSGIGKLWPRGQMWSAACFV